MELSCLGQHDYFPLRTDHLLDLGCRFLRLELLELKQHADQLEFASLVEFLQGNRRNKVFGDSIFQVDHKQHPFPANECVALDQEDAIEQIDRLGRRIGSVIGVVQGAGRWGVHDQREIGLIGKPLEYFLPRLITKRKSQQLGLAVLTDEFVHGGCDIRGKIQLGLLVFDLGNGLSRGGRHQADWRLAGSLDVDRAGRVGQGIEQVGLGLGRKRCGFGWLRLATGDRRAGDAFGGGYHGGLRLGLFRMPLRGRFGRTLGWLGRR